MTPRQLGLSNLGGAEEALDAAETEMMSGCEFTGCGSVAVGARHGLDHLVGESFAKAPRCRAGRFSLWPLLPCGREYANLQVSSSDRVRVSGKYLHQRF